MAIEIDPQLDAVDGNIDPVVEELRHIDVYNSLGHEAAKFESMSRSLKSGKARLGYVGYAAGFASLPEARISDAWQAKKYHKLAVKYAAGAMLNEVFVQAYSTLNKANKSHGIDL